MGARDEPGPSSERRTAVPEKREEAKKSEEDPAEQHGPSCVVVPPLALGQQPSRQAAQEPKEKEKEATREKVEGDLSPEEEGQDMKEAKAEGRNKSEDEQGT